MRVEVGFRMLSSLVVDQADLSRRAAELNERFEGATPTETIRGAGLGFGRGLAATSSFGAESVVLLHMISEVNPDLPIIFLDTLRHFPETHAYKEELIGRLKLSAVVEATPNPGRVRFEDPKLDLAKRNPDRCCRMRKKLPMMEALEGFDAYLTGRKRSQTAERSDLALFEVQDRWIKVNPLAHWTKSELDLYIDSNDLPRHPLESWGYLSIGCEPCTSPVKSGADPRAGRWAGMPKTECGIHFSEEFQLDWAC